MKDTVDYRREYYIKSIMQRGRGRGRSFLSFSASLMFLMLFKQRGCHANWKIVFRCEMYASLCFAWKKKKNGKQHVTNGFDASSYVVKADGAGLHFDHSISTKSILEQQRSRHRLPCYIPHLWRRDFSEPWGPHRARCQGR